MYSRLKTTPKCLGQLCLVVAVVIHGVLLLFPQLLVALVAAAFIMGGVALCALSWNLRRLRRRSQTPFVNWFIRW